MEVVMLVCSETGKGFEVRKVKKAVEVLKEIVRSMGARFVDVKVSGTSFYDDAAVVLRSL